MTLTMRKYQTEDDYWRIRAFLREVFLLNDRRELGWQAARLDYWRWHMVANVGFFDSIDQALFIWETEAGKIGAVLNGYCPDEAILTIHPNFQSPELEDEMLSVAEEQIGKPGERFFAFVHSLTPWREEVLARRGYTLSTTSNKGHQWRRDLTLPLPAVALSDGYTARAIGEIGGRDWPERSWVSWRAFHPDEPDEDYDGWEWSLNWTRSPLYRRDLDMVAVDPDGKVVAYCILWYDDVTRAGLLEPVAVMPEHQRKGLARAIVTEAMRRAQNLGATLAMVRGFEPGPNAFYRSALSPEHDLETAWVKML